MKTSQDFNPFNRESGSYGYSTPMGSFVDDQDYDLHDSSRSNNLSKWVLVAFSVSIALVLIAVTLSVVVIHNAKGDARSSIDALNTSMKTVSTVFESEDVLGSLREESRKRGGDERTALIVAADSGRKVSENKSQVNPGMKNTEAGLIVKPYFELCDAMRVIPQNMEGLDSAYSSCSEMSEDAINMMENVSRYNSLVSSPLKMTTFGVINTDPLPDVTKP